MLVYIRADLKANILKEPSPEQCVDSFNRLAFELESQILDVKYEDMREQQRYERKVQVEVYRPELQNNLV